MEKLKIDGKLTKSEISEVKEISKDQEKARILLDTQKDFTNFIDSDYRWANENYLADNGKAVEDLQKKLCVQVTGIFSKETFFALIKYQKENGLIVDGISGPKTNLSLFGFSDLSKLKVKQHYKQKFQNESLSNINYGNSNFYSRPLEKKGSMTYCSKTARLNLEDLGIPKSDIPRGVSAIESMNMYNEENYVNNIPGLPNKYNVLDLFVDTTSIYEHRAAAYKSDGEWFVLDPYARQFANTRSGIPLKQYKTKYKIMGVFPKISEKIA